MSLKNLLNHLKAGKEMTPEEVRFFLERGINERLGLSEQKAILLALNQKGYTGNEIAHFVSALSGQMLTELHMPDAIDICGTGGSGLPRINTSTLCAFIASAAGIPVAKHGNKAAGGRFGSFDLLEALDINITPPPDTLEHLYKKENLAFIYAPQFHPAMKHFAEARRDIGQKTIFNLLGPLLNPARPFDQIIGCSKKSDMPLLMQATKVLGKRHALIVRGSDGLDEVTLTGPTDVMELKDGWVREYTLTPQDFGLGQATFEEIGCGIAERNVLIARAILEGRCKTAHVNLVLANAALILKFADQVSDLKEGARRALQILKSGAALQKFERYKKASQIPDILKNIVIDKKAEIKKLEKELPLSQIKPGLKKSDRSFKKALKGKRQLSLIAEIKKESPSNPGLYQGDLDVTTIAELYEQNGADAISIVTDQKYFRGDLNHLREVSKVTRRTPLLMKDFIIDPYQIYLARYLGANAVLLIVALLDVKTLKQYLKITRQLGMHALVEVHDKKELDIALKTSADIIGVNNRNLHTFEIDFRNVLRLLPHIPKDRIVVAESGYNANNIVFVQGLCDAVLVGTTLMRESNIAQAIRSFKRCYRLLKICGVTNEETARYCEEQKVPMVGLNFVKKSQRFVTPDQAKMLRKILKSPLAVGVFQNQPAEAVNRIAEELDLDYVQLSGNEPPDYCQKITRPVIKTIRISKRLSLKQIRSYGDFIQYFIFDGKKPGSGQNYDYSRLNKLNIRSPFLVAGGITPLNVRSVYKRVSELSGIDVASGVETDGKKDLKKIHSLIQNNYA